MDNQSDQKDVYCIICSSVNNIKRGHDRVDGCQLYTCKECHKTFNIKAVHVKEIYATYSTRIQCIECGCNNHKLHHVKRDEFDLVCKECSETTRIDLETIQQMVDDCLQHTELHIDEDMNYIQEEPPKQAHIELTETDGLSDEYTKKEIVRLAKSRQFNMDKNRIERKIVRDHFRVDNTVEELEKNILDILKNGFDLSVNNKDIKSIRNENKEVMGILQLSDLHFGEIIDGVFGNSYNFDVASKRLKMFVDRSKVIFKSKGITNVSVVMTGDMLNNSSIESKKLNQEYNRAYALMIGCYLIENVIIDLASDFNITVASVSGNESRIDRDYAEINKVITNNFDWVLHNILKMNFRNFENVKFIDGRFDEKIITFFGDTTRPTHVLLTHGNNISSSDYHKNVQSLIGRYQQQGLSVDYVLSGHIHSAAVSDIYCRSSSLCSGNNYSINSLNLYGRASQNIHLIYSDGNRDSMKIDLQNIDGVVGYDLNQRYVQDITTKFVKLEDMVIHVQ